MEKTYKYYFTKGDKITIILAVLFLIAVFIWVVLNKKFYSLISLASLIFLLFIYPIKYKLTSENMLSFIGLFGRIRKPILVKEITRVTQKSKNELIVVYHSAGLRGDAIMRLSETEMKDFLDELNKRNPKIVVE